VRPSGVWDRNGRSVRGDVLEALVEKDLLAIGRYVTSYTLIDVCYQVLRVSGVLFSLKVEAS